MAQKVLLVAKLQKITKLEFVRWIWKERHILYIEMDKSDQLDVDEIEKLLKATFSDDTFTRMLNW